MAGGAGSESVHRRISLPDSGGETSRAVWELVNQRRAGLFHVAGAEKLSRWQIGRLVADRWPQLNPKITTGLGKKFSRPAARAGHVTGHFQGAESFISAATRFGRMAGRQSGRAVLIRSSRCQSAQTPIERTSPLHNFVSNSRTVIEYGGNTRMKSAPNPSAFSETGMIF